MLTVHRIMEAARKTTACIDDSGQRPVVSGTDIKVSPIASEVERLGMTADEVVEAHPHLSLADVHAALSYYYDHQELIRGEWQAAETIITALRGRYPSRLGTRAS